MGRKDASTIFASRLDSSRTFRDCGDQQRLTARPRALTGSSMGAISALLVDILERPLPRAGWCWAGLSWHNVPLGYPGPF